LPRLRDRPPLTQQAELSSRLDAEALGALALLWRALAAALSERSAVLSLP
jgi:hypothetical protein